ncbi:hypothetical protein PQX77_007101 [Marasmius sp. AFHP31]|nr:hypothetical protein PQX77_007101 [Marasmius sp. AFHP31]
MNTRPNTQRGGSNPLLKEYSREKDLNLSLLDLNDGGKDGINGDVSCLRPESPMMMETVQPNEEEVNYHPMDIGDAVLQNMDVTNATQDPKQEAHDVFNLFVQYPEDDSQMDTSNLGNMVQEDM